ncbi:zinc knuckle-domain-containing protein [Penicillium digitatum]|uniref:Zinc knuckle-domain-containing protein n=1 Tax=Penicillium digitatum TaxID=36651 RepID=A0A7T6XS99_PENDI|nr:hypothetical protein PDIDSM_2633 [Penicillium digitatum]QQK46499.1 zinc knuckle-domain-containing protein [Penicillium digitatum]
MNRYRNAPKLGGSNSNRATATTLCQKCLGRDIFDCKASAQERPYIPRPSRTQQLLNPDLMPKLSSENPNELLRKEGVADELLATRGKERGRKRDLDDMTDLNAQSPKRARSLSVETISTNRSYSSSPRHDKIGTADRGRRDDSSASPAKSRKRRYSGSTEGSSGSFHSGPKNRSPSRERTDDRNTRRRRRESSPDERGRHRGAGRHSERRDRRNKSVDKDRVKESRATTQDAPQDRSYRDRASPPLQSQPGRSRPEPTSQKNQPLRERSLSPFSKRLALTQAMNAER